MVDVNWSRACWVALLVLALLVPGRLAGAAEDGAPLAIKGYDPVAYFEIAEPTRGDPAISLVWDGLEYRFATRHHLTLFEHDPDRYAPRYRNFCASALARGHKIEADPRNWLIQDGKLFLFGGANGPRAMAENGPEIMNEADDAFAELNPREPEPGGVPVDTADAD